MPNDIQNNYDKFSPTKSGASYLIALGLSPSWTEVKNSEDRKRSGYKDIPIWKSEKKQSILDKRLKEIDFKK